MSTIYKRIVFEFDFVVVEPEYLAYFWYLTWYLTDD